MRLFSLVVIGLASLGCLEKLAHGQQADGSQPESSRQNWSQWRGPNRTSVIESPWLAAQADFEQLELLWRIPLPPSYSGPIIADDRVFVTETKDKKLEIARALDRKTGKQLWEVQWEGATAVPFFAKANGDWIRATPTYSEGLLYVNGIRDVLVCLNAETGAEVWRVDFVAAHGGKIPDFGAVTSPLIDSDDLYTQAGDAVFKINKRTGEILWKSLQGAGGMMSGGSFSSPVIASLCGQRQLVVQTRDELAGLDLATGNVQWKQNVPTFRGMNILTPVVIGDQIFTSCYQGGTYLFEIKRSGETWNVEQLWKKPAQGYMSSPVVINGFVYLHLRNQRFTCLDLKTGDTKWISDPFGQYWSMIAAGDRILALDERGDLMLIRANPEKFELLAKKHLSDDSTWAHLGLTDNQIFVRELKAMSVYSPAIPKSQ